jgi:thiamine-phosphate pyrophosphorylase
VDARFEFYAITDQNSSKGRSDLDIARALIAAGVSCLQYRAKKVSAREQWETAFQLRRISRDAGVIFIVNDRIDLALDCEADGVHLGQDDTPMDAARRIAGKKLLIGRSTHSFSQAREAEAQGADYIGFGPLYLTGTKENNIPPLGPAAIVEVLASLKIPVVAIGGIKLRQLPELASLGVEHIAVVTALTGSDQVENVTRDYVTSWKSFRK